jgi:hypothetical protein
MNLDVGQNKNGVTIKAVHLGWETPTISMLYLRLHLLKAPRSIRVSRFKMVYLPLRRYYGRTDGDGFACDFLPDESAGDNKGTMAVIYGSQ